MLIGFQSEDILLELLYYNSIIFLSRARISTIIKTKCRLAMFTYYITVGNTAYYARPGPPNLQAMRTPVAVLRRHILSLPLAAGLPPLIRQIGWVCSLRSAPVANPSSTAQRGRGSPRP
jgi:hypothetical protein